MCNIQRESIINGEIIQNLTHNQGSSDNINVQLLPESMDFVEHLKNKECFNLETIFGFLRNKI